MRVLHTLHTVHWFNSITSDQHSTFQKKQKSKKGHPNADPVQDSKHLGDKFMVFMINYNRFILGEKEAKSLILMIMTEKG
jgi:hypothetical protein